MKKTTKVAALMLAVAMMMTACGGNADQAADTGAAVDETTVDAANTDNEANEADETDAVDAEEEQPASLTRTEGVITFGTNAEFPPFEFVAGSGVIDQ